MDVGLGTAGLLCVLLAIGHTTIGVRWVLPGLTPEHVPSTPFGSSSMTASMIRVTWFIVTIFVSTLGGLLISLAWDQDADPKRLLLRWFAAMWLAAAVMALSIAARRVQKARILLRLPVPFVWVVIAALCWNAST